MEGEFSGKIFLGGIYLSKREVQELQKGSVVFYDASQNLKKLLESEKEKLTIQEIDTRNRDSLELANEALNKLTDFLDNCEEQLKAMKIKYQQLVEKIQSASILKQNIFFFMGEITANAYPEYLVGDDLFIKYLMQQSKMNKKFIGLPYLPWSAKNLRENPDALKMGLVSRLNGRKGKILDFELEEIDKNSNRWNLYHPGILVPGAFQLEVASFVLNHFGKK